MSSSNVKTVNDFEQLMMKVVDNTLKCQGNGK